MMIVKIIIIMIDIIVLHSRTQTQHKTLVTLQRKQQTKRIKNVNDFNQCRTLPF